jgi:hypothetical protein
VNALEIGRRGPRAPAVPVIMAALERAGVRFLAAADGLGQGVRYRWPEPEPAGARPSGLCSAPGAAGPGSVAGISDRRLAAAEARTRTQRELAGRLGPAGPQAGMARELLREMERAVALLRQSRELVGARRPGSGSVPLDAAA